MNFVCCWPFSKILHGFFGFFCLGGLVFSFKDLERICMVLLGGSLNGGGWIIMVVLVVDDDAFVNYLV
jgi:hypothetical protein